MPAATASAIIGALTAVASGAAQGAKAKKKNDAEQDAANAALRADKRDAMGAGGGVQAGFTTGGGGAPMSTLAPNSGAAGQIGMQPGTPNPALEEEDPFPLRRGY